MGVCTGGGVYRWRCVQVEVCTGGSVIFITILIYCTLAVMVTITMASTVNDGLFLTQLPKDKLFQNNREGVFMGACVHGSLCIWSL